MKRFQALQPVNCLTSKDSDSTFSVNAVLEGFKTKNVKVASICQSVSMVMPQSD